MYFFVTLDIKLFFFTFVYLRVSLNRSLFN